jgi:hypothetical protein
MLESFIKKKWQPGYNYIVLGRDNPDVFIVLCALLVSVRSNSRRKMGLTLSLNNELFSEKIPYIQLNANIKDRASCVERWLYNVCFN